MAHITAENTSACRSLSSPRAVGRQAVRFMRASMPFSTRQLKAAAAPATNQMPALASTMRSASAQLGTPGTASTMPIRAQNTMSWITRGLVSALNCRITDGVLAGDAAAVMREALKKLFG